MSYIDETLLDDETCCHRAHPHWIIYWYSALVFGIGLMVLFNWVPFFGFLSLYRFYGLSLTVWLSFILFAFAGYHALVSHLNLRYSEYGITNKRILMKQGFINRSATELFLDKVEAVQVVQSIVGRYFDYGAVIIVGTGGSRDAFTFVPQPFLFRKKVQQQIDQYKANRS